MLISSKICRHIRTSPFTSILFEKSTQMDRRTFAILCHLLRIVAGLSSTKIVDIEEMVAMFLHVLAYDELIKRPVLVTNNYNDQRWKCFENCLGALNETYIKVNVPTGDRPTFRTRKGKFPQTFWGCATRKEISFMSSPVGKDPQQTRGFYVMPFTRKWTTRYYYLCDAGYQNAEGFLVPYRGQRYHLQEWRGAANVPTNPNEYFNMKYSSARNVIQRAFGVLKGCWDILRGKSYYPLQVQCRDSTYATTTTSEDIHYIEKSSIEEEGTLVECLMELVSMGGWKSDNGTFRLGYLTQLDDVRASRPSRASEGRTGSSGSKRKRGSQRDLDVEGIHLALDKTNKQLRMIAEWPTRALANDNHVRTKFFRILRKIPELTSLDRALLKRHLLSRMDDLRGFVLMPEDEREGFCRVLLRDIAR
ncbi:retrotransposon protein [Cucumis melo var. makuwa]|uniref:Retrotransposon protein n=1 Tax=Cucumis melo var. makuwa TaxID=1194695 RepID=A0A5A7VHS9_CUCMM|nr:retrotransposon protein [Cucumis melo var. makuwa]